MEFGGDDYIGTMVVRLANVIDHRCSIALVVTMMICHGEWRKTEPKGCLPVCGKNVVIT